MNSRRLIMIFRWVVAAAALAGIVLVYSLWLHVNQTTVALTMLLLVLALAANWSLRYAVGTAVAATVAYNFFFLPPVGHIVISDTENWVALFVFLITAVVGSRLSQRARDQAQQSRAKQREVEVSFQLGRELLQMEDVSNLLTTLPMLIVRVTGATSVLLYLLEGDVLLRHGATNADTPMTHLRQVALSLSSPDVDTNGEMRVPIMTGARPKGLLLLQGVSLSLETLQTIGGLVSISLDRAQTLEKLAREEANKESERLRTLIIDSITHELRTPLTSIKGAASTLRANRDLRADLRNDLVDVVDEESDRLNLLVERATEMSRLDSQQVHMTFAPVDVNELLEGAKDTCAAPYAQHPVTVSVPPMPKVYADAEFITKVLCNLLENAAKYSPQGSPIFLSAVQEGGVIAISVADRGYGIDPIEQALVFDRFYRARNPNQHVSGTGMGLAISKSIIEAHDGSIKLTSQPGSGSVFTFTLPIVSV